ncbi:glutamine synthetase [Aquibium carbonis]|uniref:Glutamine synthetase n=1 Tax=Aquibium carbonis TaxID=2495581 RepID=A0A429Z245_9HYPH|nr:glutamine synthetase family protein [Aquibium carbonis]RST87785.1 glutamine synthetase [Aquibium carbonis]
MSGDNPSPLVSIVTTDLSAITRGRPLTETRYAKSLETGVGWVPANLCLTAFNTIADPNPWGSSGDLRILPDAAARYATSATGAATRFDLVMGDIVELDGTPWIACARTQLRDALAALEAQTGLCLVATFEQEFTLVTGGGRTAAPPLHAFSVEALRSFDPFAPRLAACLEEAGVEPEMVLAEYGANQFEITHAPTDGLSAADRAVAIREITREVARTSGARASFAPKPAADQVGNGVHIHFSLRDASGRPATHDAARPGRLSKAAGAFCAGVLRHLPGLVALTASSVPSYYRLAPHNWSSSYTWLGERDREATLRICPTVTIGGRDPEGQFNIEYRAADATANPYLALAAIVRAGLAGLLADLPAPPIVSGDPSVMSAPELDRLGLRRLPETLDEALAALEADTVVTSWFAPELLASFVAVKRAEIGLMAGLDRDAICAAYGGRY